MKYSYAYILIALVVIVFGVAFWGIRTGTTPPADTSAKPQVAATLFPIYDIAREIAGSDADVQLLLPPGASPHTFDLTPQHIRDLQRTDLVLKVGLLDDWIDPVAQSLPDARIVLVHDNIALHKSEHDHEHEEEEHEEGEEHEHATERFDPHYWLSAENAHIIAENIANELVALDPEHADQYRARLVAYQGELTALHAELTNTLAPVAKRNIITFHEGWRYFAESYDLSIVGVFEPSPGRQPTPAYLANLQEAAETHGVEVVFSEPQLPNDTLRPFVSDLGLTLSVLDPLGGVAGRDSYIEMMRYNAETIARALMGSS